MLKEYLKELAELNRVDPWGALNRLNSAPTDLYGDLKEYFKHNLADWIDYTCLADDPDHADGLRRFVLFPAQRESIVDRLAPLTATADPEPCVLLWEKARRVGWTNTLLFCILHAALFWGRSSIVATKDLAAADTLGDPQNSLLPRLRLALEYQPTFLLPKLTSIRGLLRIGDSTIRGCPTASIAAARKLGRSGRVRFALFDEAAFWRSEHLETAFGACAFTAKVRIVFSSPCDDDSHFFSRLVDGSAIEGIKGVWVPFEANPANDAAYLNELRRLNTPEVIAREIFGERGTPEGKIFAQVPSGCWQC